MTTRILTLVASLALLGAGLRAPAQTAENEAARLPLEPAVTNLNRLSVSYRMGFNISADFRNLGGFRALNPLSNPRHPLSTAHGDPYNYDNGYIYPQPADLQPLPGFTWYYGYTAGTAQSPADAPTQFDLFRSSSAATGSSLNNDGDPQHGVQITYNRQLGPVGEHGAWGLELAAGFTDITISDSRTLRGLLVRNTDTYATGGGLLNPPPFSGTFEGPGPNDANGWPPVSLTPVGSSVSSVVGGASITGHRELDAQMVDLRFGPYLDLPLSQRLQFTLSGGGVVLFLHSDFTFDETVSLDPAATLVPLPSERHHGSDSSDKVLAGGYVSGLFSYALSDRWRLLAGAQFQVTDDATLTAAGKKATLSLGQVVFVNLGLSYSF